MPLIKPLRRQDLAQHEATFKMVENALGVLPNATLTMARWPELMDAFARLNAVVMADGAVNAHLKQMIAATVSSAAGCSYCHAHTAHVGLQRGLASEKLEQLWEFEASALFSDAERAALRVAQGAGLSPSGVADGDRDELRKHYDERQVVEIVAVIANFGFLNRWNDTMATTLEASPLQWAQSHLEAAGWTAGSHAPDPTTAPPVA